MNLPVACNTKKYEFRNDVPIASSVIPAPSSFLAESKQSCKHSVVNSFTLLSIYGFHVSAKIYLDANKINLDR